MMGVLRVGPFYEIYIFAENDKKGEESILSSSSVSKKKVQQEVDSVESFLQSLGLDKYSITFQAEEVDMAALVHMSDEYLKAMGIPMGPRKKILLELESKRDD
ncbi:Usher syndrome type-1G protein-like [Salvia splendens]|nr:Usher syndrome type-1G protein-like [Salvia splendens]